MKFMKKIMPIVLCAMMLFALIPCAALADGAANISETTLNDGDKVTFGDVEYVFTAASEGATCTLTYDASCYEVWLKEGNGTLTVNNPNGYMDFLNGYDLADETHTTVKFAVNGEKLSLIEGGIALDGTPLVTESVYLCGAKVEGNGLTNIYASTKDDVTTGTVCGAGKIMAENGAVLTFVNYEDSDAIEVWVCEDGTIEAVLGDKMTVTPATNSEMEFAYSPENGAELEINAGEAEIGLEEDEKFTLVIGWNQYLITATQDVTLTLVSGVCPESDDSITVETSLSDSHEHTWGPFVSIDSIDHVRECLDESCDAYELMEHAWEKGLVIKEPTHTSYGEQRYTCWFCDATKIMPVEKLWQHNYESGWTHDEDAHWHACECGEKSEKAAHTFENIVHELALMTEGDCENGAVYYKSCSVCGALSDETFVGAGAEGHKFGEYTSDGNATCKEDGTKTATCSACGEKNTVTDAGSKIAHNFGEYTADGNATCEADGTKSATCSVCGAKDTVTDAGSKTAHSFGEYTSDGSATCEADGTKTATCSVCGAKDTVTDEGSKLAHTYEKGICTACGAEDPECMNLTWLWIALGALAVLGGGFAVYWCVIRKKTK